jgi:N-formylmaleamate deformylase
LARLEPLEGELSESTVGGRADMTGESYVRPVPQGTSGYVVVDGVHLHHLEYGKGGEPTIVVLPGITSPAITWEFVAERLAARGAHVLVLDIRGRGLSSVTETSYTLSAYVSDAVGVIEELGLERPLILGHSMGARIATALGATCPERCGPLIVADPPLTGPGRAAYPMPLDSFRQQLHEAYKGTTAADVQRLYPRWSNREAHIRAQWLSTCAEHAVVESWENFHTEDFFVLWRRLRDPLLFIYGAESPVVTPEGLVEVRAANPRAEVVAIARAGHMIPWENLEDFLHAVSAFARLRAERV